MKSLLQRIWPWTHWKEEEKEKYAHTLPFPLPEPPGLSQDLEARLSPGQREAVRSPFAKTLVVAGPGAGKTLTLVRRVQYMVERGIPGQEIALITFTRKAAEEMRSRLQVLVGGKAAHAFVGTFHSYALHLLQAAGLDVDLLDEEEAMALFRKVTKDFPYGRFQKLLGILPPEELKGRALEAYRRYQEAKASLGKWDFEDLIREATWNEKVKGVLRPHLLVDEYQDLNWSQLRFLMREEHRSLYGVGDPKQSIYGWRGSDRQIMLRFPEHFPGAKVYHLKENFRSAAPIVAMANRFVERRGLGETQQVLSPNPGETTLHEVPDLGEALKRGVEEALRLSAKYGNTGVAILYRNRTHKGLDVEGTLGKLLVEAGLPQGLPHPLGEILEFRIFERILEHFLHTSQETAERLITLPLPEEVRSYLRGGRFPEETERVYTTRGQALVALWRALLQEDLHRLAAFLEGPLATKALAASEGRIGIAYAVAKTLAAIARETAAAYPDPTPMDLHNHLWERVGTSPEGVTLSTVHGSKGLEWPAVVVVGVNEGLFPSASSPLEEEALLLYVAITRARQDLVVIGSGSFFADLLG